MNVLVSGTEPFLATIRESGPFVAGPRLVLADWLEERGECSRAYAIRYWVDSWASLRRTWTRAIQMPQSPRWRSGHTVPAPLMGFGRLINTTRYWLLQEFFPVPWGDAQYWPDGFKEKRESFDAGALLGEATVLRLMKPPADWIDRKGRFSGSRQPTGASRAWRLKWESHWPAYSAMTAVMRSHKWTPLRRLVADIDVQQREFAFAG